MRRIKIHHAVLLAVGLSFSSVSAQSGGKPQDAREVEADRTCLEYTQFNMAAKLRAMKQANTGQYDPSDQSLNLLASTYVKAAKYKQPTQAVLCDALDEMKTGEALAKSTYQSMDANLKGMSKLQALQVAQNGRMIELLEYIAARTKQ